MAWIASLQGSAVMIGVALLAGWGWLRVHDNRIANRVSTEIVQASKEQGAQSAAKSDQAFDAARKPGAFERLRKARATCPDCGK